MLFSSLLSKDEFITLDDYVASMREGQSDVYILDDLDDDILPRDKFYLTFWAGVRIYILFMWKHIDEIAFYFLQGGVPAHRQLIFDDRKLSSLTHNAGAR